MLGLLMTPAKFDAMCIKKAVKGLGTDEAALIEILCSRTNEEMKALKEAYKKSWLSLVCLHFVCLFALLGCMLVELGGKLSYHRVICFLFPVSIKCKHDYLAMFVTEQDIS